jgi:DNA polymerase III epsilon subunit-like protein
MNTQLAFELAQQWLSDECLILDTETTGLGEDAEIVEIAIIDSRGTVLLDSLVQPVRPIPFDASAIHGISNEMVKGAPRMSELLHQINRIISGKTLVAYNADYDVRLLHQSLEMCGFGDSSFGDREIALHTVKIGCAMKAYARWNGTVRHGSGDYKWHKLTDAASYCRVELAGDAKAHRALADCQLTLGVLRHMTNYVDTIRAERYGQQWCISRDIGQPQRVGVQCDTACSFFDVEVGRLFERRRGFELFATSVNGELSFCLDMDVFSARALQLMFPALKLVPIEPTQAQAALTHEAQEQEAAL